MLWLTLTSLIALEVGESTTFSGIDQTVTEQYSEPVVVADVEVWGRRGAAAVAPEIELNGADIDALAAWDIGEVLSRLIEILGVGEQPVVIVNGKRVANASVFNGFPPDALVRAEILPPEAAIIYGGAPGQRVINLVLQPRFGSYDGRAADARPTQGGTYSFSGELRRSVINEEKTYRLGVRTVYDAALLSNDRDLPDMHPENGVISLRPRVRNMAANAIATGSIGRWASVFSMNGQVRDSLSTSYLGGSFVESRRRNDSLNGSVGFSGLAAGWSLQANLNGQASRSREDGFLVTQNENQSVGFTGSAGRTVFDLATGPVALAMTGNWAGVRSVTDGGQVRTTNRFQTSEARGSLAVPLSKGNSETSLGRIIGDLQATIGGSVRASSAGGGDGGNLALDWAPRRKLRLGGVWSVASDSVSDTLRFEPLYYEAPRLVFDFRSGQAVMIAPLLGGNPDLRSPRSEQFSLNAAAGPYASWGVSGSVGYQKAETTDGIGSLPELTEDVEAAFPDRFQRDANGRLVSIDYRPMNLSSSLTEGLTTTINFSLPRPQGAAANEAMVARFSLNYNLQLRNTVALLAGLPDLDRLRGDGGGVSRQSARAMLDAKRGRWGLNASARWQDGYRTRRNGGRDDPADLVVKPFAAVDLKLTFQMMSSSIRASSSNEEGGPRRRSSGLQVNLEVENLFDARPEARLGDGSAAPGYGRDVQDPIGRVVRLSLQRRF